MGKKEDESKVQISLFVSRPLKHRLATFCMEEELSQTDAITEALGEYLDCPPDRPGNERDDAAGRSMLKFGLLMLQLSADQRAVALEHITKDGVATVDDYISSLGSSENPIACELAGQIERTVFYEDDAMNEKMEGSAAGFSKKESRRKSSEDDRAINIRLSADLHRRYKREAIERGESMNLMIVRAMLEYAEREGF